MRTYTTLAVFTASLISTASAGTYYVDNYCPFPLYLVSTSTPPQSSMPPLITLEPNTPNAYSEVMRSASSNLNALSISQNPDMSLPLQATYHQTTTGPSPGLDFYAVSEIYGHPLLTQGFQLLTQPDGFSINCPPRAEGQYCPYTYSAENPEGKDAVFYENDLEDLRLLLCRFDVTGTADAP